MSCSWPARGEVAERVRPARGQPGVEGRGCWQRLAALGAYAGGQHEQVRAQGAVPFVRSSGHALHPTRARKAWGPHPASAPLPRPPIHPPCTGSKPSLDRSSPCTAEQRARKSQWAAQQGGRGRLCSSRRCHAICSCMQMSPLPSSLPRAPRACGWAGVAPRCPAHMCLHSGARSAHSSSATAGS